jgi:hypothetical protein
VWALAAALGCAPAARNEAPVSPDMNPIAERYVKLVLKVGQHDPDYVDAYYGDPAWKPGGAPEPLSALIAEAGAIRAALPPLRPPADAEELVRLRFAYLDRQVAAVESRLAMLAGERFSFDEESRRLYDAVAPQYPEGQFQQVLDEMEGLLPGTGSLAERYAAFRQGYLVPPDRLDAVFRAAIEACRARTLPHLSLPAGEQFTVEYVTGKSWSGYNWYQGGFQSLIQVNTDLPITIDRAIDLACHEGYPGHHVYNAALEQALVRDRGWIEFSVYALFSPQSLIAEGTANFGIEVAFPGGERLSFERDILYALAGLDPATAARYAAVNELTERLKHAENEAARRYLDGEIDREAAIVWLQRWAMLTRDRAEQRTRFFDQYRSYVINYTVGRDLVRAYVERQGGTPDHPDVRWRVFGALLASPRLPSGLIP